MDYKMILLAKEEGVATITLNRPEQLNGISPELLHELGQATEDVANDDAIGAVVLTGAGNAFCAGGDLTSTDRWPKSSEEIKVSMTGNITPVLLGFRKMPKPIIAAVNGAAVGAGCNLPLACDMVFASDKARFGEVFIKVGLHTEFGGIYFLPRLVGMAKACELIFTGKIIDAMEAERIGLINKVIPHDELLSTVTKLARSLAKGPAMAMRMVKHSLYQALDTDLEGALKLEVEAQSVCLMSHDGKEGIAAFLEKRPAVFLGR